LHNPRATKRYAQQVTDMLLDDILIAMTLGGLMLSALFIYADFRDAERRRGLEQRRSNPAKAPRLGHQSTVEPLGGAS
jgi:hypothetical protein